MRNSQAAKLFLVILLLTGYIFSFSHFGAMAYSNVFATSDQFAENTTIGNIDISNTNSIEAKKRVTDAWKNWLENSKTVLVYKDKSVDLDLKIFDILTEKSIEASESKKKNELLVIIHHDKLLTSLNDISPKIVNENSIDVEKLKIDLLSLAATLRSGENSIDLETYLLTEEKIDVISEASISNTTQKVQLQKWAKNYPKVDIAAYSQFSLLRFLKDEGVTTFNPEALSMIASSIHQVLLPTNISINERHIGRELPTDIELGFEAKVNPDNLMDYAFTNPNDDVYTLQFKMIDDLFHVSLVGPETLFQYKINLVDKESFQPKVIRHFDSKLNKGIQKTKIEGKEGLLVKVFREKKDEMGQSVDNVLLYEDFYPPLNKIIVQSLLDKKLSEEPNNNTSDNTNEDNGIEVNPDEEKEGLEPDNVPTPSVTTPSKEDKESLWGKENEGEK